MDAPNDQNPSTLPDDIASALTLIAHVCECRAATVRGHGRRVEAMARRLAPACDLPMEEHDALFRAALMHDIGKASLPVEILGKPHAMLTGRERIRYESHPQAGAAMIRSFLGDSPIAERVAAHHEAFDGSGFPDKRKADEIPLAARILSTCDRFDRHLIGEATANARPVEEALDLLKRDAETLLDPDIVSAMTVGVPEWLAEAIREHILVPPELLHPDMLLAADVINVSGIRALRAGTKVYQKLIDKLLKDKLIDSAATTIPVLLDSLPKPGVPHSSRAAKAPEPRDTGSPEDSGKAKRPLVVVIDDEANVVNALNRELRSAGYRVKTFTRALDALCYMRDERGERKGEEVFALITDYNMPGMRGDNLLHNVQLEFPDLPCIVLTGLATKDTVISLARAAHIRKILPKPWDKTLLLEILSGIGT